MTLELRTFLRRNPDGSYRLETEDGRLLAQGRTYRDVRRDLDRMVAKMINPPRVKVLIGAPPTRLPPQRSHVGAYAALAEAASLA